MSEPDDILGREVVIAAKLEENGVAVRVKSRAAAAFDRLVGSLVDIPAAFAEGVARKKRIKDHINERLLLAQAEMAERKLKGLPNVGDALLVDILKDAARKQTNAAGVAIEALDALKALPPPNDTEEAPSDEADVAIDEDWMNQFTRYAEDASSEQLQQLWGRVLAGEINRKGSFSRHTLRFIAELDKETAENCEYAAERTIGDFIPKAEEWNKGHRLLLGLDLQRLGLVEGVGGIGPQRTFRLSEDGVWFLAKGTKALVVNGEPGTEIKMNTILLTRMGKEVFSLLAPSDDELALRDAGGLSQKSGVKTIELGTIVQEHDGNVRFFAQETLWEKEPPAD